ncbi:hypothetical protein Poli38472_012239 [Pythium oligandrum]|uniref:Uncharacterized protein n=1 Tax=Pythium oligandrum TaxID=41045 RepID=A0A8K1FR08_PYTOL|nr:hypothetical protein Poli38472_012239 [Pythium oligandrum]|eukprot:TMW67123.1 hypothetical protein Poli38472_012239 [Pythium oligandrum]
MGMTIERHRSGSGMVRKGSTGHAQADDDGVSIPAPSDARLAAAGTAPTDPLGPVLFLDVDGVLNIFASNGFTALHDSLLARLARVAQRSGVRVVLSSSWRHDGERLTLLGRIWRQWRLDPIADVTPTLSVSAVGNDTSKLKDKDAMAARQRVLEIHQWLQQAHYTGQWVAVDDLDLAAEALPGMPTEWFVRTRPHQGLCAAEADEILRLLGESDDGRALTARPGGHLLHEFADLLVVWDTSSPSSVTVIATCDFAIVAEVETAENGFRRWLLTQNTEITQQRMVGIQLHESSEGDSCHHPAALQVVVSLEQITGLSVQSFAHHLMSDTEVVLQDLIHKLRELDERSYCQETALPTLFRMGFTTAQCTVLFNNEALVRRLLSVASALSPSTPTRLALTLDVCRFFTDDSSRRLRKWLVECIVRDELTSRAALEGIRLMVAQSGDVEALDMEQLDELLSCM